MEIRVYRIEGPNGKGPYSTVNGLFNLAMCNRHHENTHPGFWRDFSQGVWNENTFSCCKSLDILIEWFSDTFDLIEGKGFFVCEYEIAKRLVFDGRSKRQSIFYKDKAILISKIEL